MLFTISLYTAELGQSDHSDHSEPRPLLHGVEPSGYFAANLADLWPIKDATFLL